MGETLLAPTNVVRTATACRLCKSRRLQPVWSFGTTPLANAYLTPAEVAQAKAEVTAPLDVQWCADCHLVQLRHVVDPEILFGDYLYVSSTSPAFVAHFERYAATLIERFALTPTSFVVDVGSNDGVLLRPLQQHGIRVLGIEPATTIARAANTAGIPTLPNWFTPTVARQVRDTHGCADVISANNVFAHTDDIDLFVESVQELLKPAGVFVFEVQYLKDLVDNNLFDIVYHEHLCYYHVAPLVRYFAQHDLAVFDVERVPTHGGSIRVYVQRQTGPHLPTTRLKEILTAEADLHTLAPYQAFAQRITQNGAALRTVLLGLQQQGARIAGFGAPAKATTLLYTFGIDHTMLDFIVDDAPQKQGRLMPGSHIPIKPPRALYEEKVDYCLILAWNFAEPIRQNHARFTAQGGKFIIPVPVPMIVDNNHPKPT